MTTIARHGFAGVVLWLAAAAMLVAAPPELRVLSYNIHHGQGTDGRFDLQRIANVITSVRPDVVALQEVDRGTRRASLVDQAEVLAEQTQLTMVYGPNLQFEGGLYGNAILTRLPVLEHTNHAMPSLDNGEQRGVLQASLEWPSAGRRLEVLATHLDARPAEAERLASAEAINQLVASGREPALLIGDLNAVPESRTLQILQQQWTSPRGEPLLTSPAEQPRRQIDYILYRPANRWQVVEIRVLDEPVASDHRPLFAVLRWQE